MGKDNPEHDAALVLRNERCLRGTAREPLNCGICNFKQCRMATVQKNEAMVPITEPTVEAMPPMLFQNPDPEPPPFCAL